MEVLLGGNGTWQFILFGQIQISGPYANLEIQWDPGMYNEALRFVTFVTYQIR
jgi:hypothetical protein